MAAPPSMAPGISNSNLLLRIYSKKARKPARLRDAAENAANGASGFVQKVGRSHQPFYSGLFRGEARDAITSEGSDPEFFTYLDGNGAGAKLSAVGLLQHFLNLHRLRINLHDI